MKYEIKEVLEDIKRHLDYVEETKQVSIRDNEIKAMYDYIINLQEEVKFTEDYKDAYETTIIANKMLDEKYKDYKARIDKAIEKLKTLMPICIMPNNTLIHGTEKAKTIEETLNILQGSDK